MSKEPEYLVGEKVVYPSHGVGEITAIEFQNIGGTEIKVYVISLPQDKMVLRVPVGRASSAGLRPLVNQADINGILEILNSKSQPGNRMWSRRAQEYEMTINSGNIFSIA